jgi:hypothetical protein
LAINASSGVVSSVNLGNNQTVSSLSSAVSGGTATLNITAPVTLTVNQAANTNFSGTIINSGTLAKLGSGTLEIDAPATLGPNSALVVNGGTLRFNVASTGAVGAGVTATIGAGGTLELAGSASALSVGANRVNVMNSSRVLSGALLVTGTNQQVGNIDGSGNVNVSAGASLAANHINQSALTIGGAMGNLATVVIALSDASGSPLVEHSASPGLAFAGSLASSESFGANSSAAANGPFSSLLSVASGNAAFDADTSSGGSSQSMTLSAVPEPSSLVLASLAGALVAAASGRRRHRYRKEFIWKK